jgi:phosphate transport system substrate-binding protein
MIRGALDTLAALVGVALAAGCSHGGEDGAPKPPDGADVALTGAGATFPYPLYTKWISEFTRARPGLKINYQSIGSGGGVRQLTEGTVDFGATDAPLSDEQMASLASRARGVVHIPTCLGAVAVAYHLDGVPSGLHLTPEAVAGIFLGAVTEWNDPLIQKENPGTALPARRIVVVHRSDGSGTTRIFTDWLAAVSPAWRRGPAAGMSVEFPSGLGAKGNEGVAGQIASMPGTLGYVELVYAVQNKLSYAAVGNAAGAFVMPSPASITAAGEGAIAGMTDDLRASVASSPGEGAYPVAGFTYVVLQARQADVAKGKALVDFLGWAVREGQTFAEPLSYAPLPAALVPRVEAKLAAITGPDGRPLRPDLRPSILAR